MKCGRIASLWVLAVVSCPLALHGEPVSCLGSMNDIIWLRSHSDRQVLDLWCDSVGPPVIVSAAAGSAEASRLTIVNWNVHVGGGRLEEVIPRLLQRSSREGAALAVLLQETFRAGADVPETIPAGL